MGLDMNLYGKKYLRNHWQEPEKNETEDGFRVSDKILEIGYWRKHPNLHGFFVNEFASGIDKCQEIPLNIKALKKTLSAVIEDELPEVTGFFFGVSHEDDREPTIIVLEKAIDWLGDDKLNEFREVYYKASW